MAWVGQGADKVHLFRESFWDGKPYNRSACGLWDRRPGKPAVRATTDDVTCGRCRQTAMFRVAQREEHS
jgi:hypothetical protein